MASLASSLAPGLGRSVAHQLQQEDRERGVARVLLCAIWRQLLTL